VVQDGGRVGQRVLSLVRVGFVPVPRGDKAGFDHADVHLASRRMYVAHTGADRVDVLDCGTRAYLRSLPGLPGVAGVLVDEAHDLLFTSDRAAARISIFRCSDEQPLGQVLVGPHPNGLAYDQRRRRLHAFNLGEPLGEGCTTSVVDLDRMRVVADLALSGRPRWALYDDERDCVYANIREPAEISVIDAETLTIDRALPVPSAGPHGLALAEGRLFCATDDGALVVLDPVAGDVLATRRLPGAPDVVMHDSERRRLHVAIGEPGLVCSFDSESLVEVGTTETEAGAHTCCWDARGRCLYVFCPESCGAAIYEDVG
jgi:DNA-binding beta-propeller fold protein YncE